MKKLNVYRVIFEKKYNKYKEKAEKNIPVYRKEYSESTLNVGCKNLEDAPDLAERAFNAYKKNDDYSYYKTIAVNEAEGDFYFE